VLRKPAATVDHGDPLATAILWPPATDH